MARGSSGGRSRSSSKLSKRSKAPTPATTPAKASPPAMSGSSTGGLGSLIVEGMTWAGANAIAHRVADAIMGPRVVQVETIASPAPAPMLPQT